MYNHKPRKTIDIITDYKKKQTKKQKKNCIHMHKQKHILQLLQWNNLIITLEKHTHTQTHYPEYTTLVTHSTHLLRIPLTLIQVSNSCRYKWATKSLCGTTRHNKPPTERTAVTEQCVMEGMLRVVWNGLDFVSKSLPQAEPQTDLKSGQRWN
jgi:hypothetical protein